MKIVLRVKTDRDQKEILLNQYENLILGRSSKSGFTVSDDRVSSQHCRLTFKNFRLEITDMNSKNGTYINGIRIEQSEIFVGDEVKIGNATLTLATDMMGPEVIEFLTFPGPTQEMIDQSLKDNFTGVRIKNQDNQWKQPVLGISQAPPRTHEQEIVLRKTAQSSIRLSYEEIRGNHRIRSSLARILDTLLLAALLYLPFHFMHFNDDVRTLQILVFSEGVILTLYLFINAKILKFTLGDVLVGLKRIYDKQEEKF